MANELTRALAHSLACSLARARSAPARMQFCTCAYVIRYVCIRVVVASCTSRLRNVVADVQGMQREEKMQGEEEEEEAVSRDWTARVVSTWHYLLKRRKRARGMGRPIRAGSAISISLSIRARFS